MPRDAFDILGLPTRFDLSPAAVQSAYLALSATLHPDATPLQPGATPRPESLAAELNEAKRTLDDPELRADLLLRRLGGPSKEQHRSLPPAFLAEMLETREAIDAAVNSKDADQIERWHDWAVDRRRAHIAAVSALFKSLDGMGAPFSADTLRTIRAELNVWRYIERLIQQLTEIQQ